MCTAHAHDVFFVSLALGLLFGVVLTVVFLIATNRID